MQQAQLKKRFKIGLLVGLIASISFAVLGHFITFLNWNSTLAAIGLHVIVLLVSVIYIIYTGSKIMLHRKAAH